MLTKAARPAMAPGRPEAAPIRIARVIPRRNVMALGKLVHAFRRLQPDMVHTQTAKADALGCVAFRLAGVPAVVHGETGLLVPPKDPQALADAILLLLDDPPRAEAMGRAGRDRVAKEFGLDRMIRETEALYEELLAAKAIARTRRTDVV